MSLRDPTPDWRTCRFRVVILWAFSGEKRSSSVFPTNPIPLFTFGSRGLKNHVYRRRSSSVKTKTVEERSVPWSVFSDSVRSGPKVIGSRWDLGSVLMRRRMIARASSSCWVSSASCAGREGIVLSLGTEAEGLSGIREAFTHKGNQSRRDATGVPCWSSAKLRGRGRKRPFLPVAHLPFPTIRKRRKFVRRRRYTALRMFVSKRSGSAVSGCATWRRKGKAFSDSAGTGTGFPSLTIACN